MEIRESKRVKESAYIEKLENGLTVIVIPRKNVKRKYIIFGTNFGSIDNRFILPGETEEKTVPDGTAHFLEHKMFEQKSGRNSLDVLTALGINANAYTTNDHTAYLYDATENFYEALDEFMDYVQNPYYTDENVEKEKGIIGQEIKMYEDYPEWQVYLNAMKCMYKIHPMRLDIAGTIDSISKIDKEVLYLCYDNFYTPSNMAIAICGDFEVEEIIGEIKKRIVNHEKKEIPKRIVPDEPEEVNEKSKVVDMKLTNPIFAIGYKDKPGEDMIKRHIAIHVALNTIIGKSSELYKELSQEGLLLGALDSQYEFSRGYAFLLITGASPKPEEVIKRITEAIENAKINGLNEKDFLRLKKKTYGDYMSEYNSVEETARAFLTDYFKGLNNFDYLDKYEEVTKEYAEKVLRELFVEEKKVTSIVK